MYSIRTYTSGRSAKNVECPTGKRHLESSERSVELCECALRRWTLTHSLEPIIKHGGCLSCMLRDSPPQSLLMICLVWFKAMVGSYNNHFYICSFNFCFFLDSYISLACIMNDFHVRALHASKGLALWYNSKLLSCIKVPVPLMRA